MTGHIRRVDPADLEPSEFHHRGRSDPDEDLQRSVKAVGVIEPPIVRNEDGDLRVIDGVRRVTAAAAVGVDPIHVYEIDVSDREAALRSLSANLDPWEKHVVQEDEEAALRRLASEMGAESAKDAADVIGLRSERDRIAEAVRGAHGVGDSVIDALEEHFGDRETVEEADVVQLQQAEGIGPSTARSIREWLDWEEGELRPVADGGTVGEDLGKEGDQ